MRAPRESERLEVAVLSCGLQAVVLITLLQRDTLMNYCWTLTCVLLDLKNLSYEI